jgi:hypothetical protein
MTLEFVLHVAIAGLLATYLHIVLAAWGHKLGMEHANLCRGMANLTFGKGYEGEPPLIWGFAIIHLNGVLFALLYAAVLAKHIPVDPPVLKGLIYAGVLLIISGFFFIPVVLEGGLFGQKHGSKSWMTTVFVHGAWGVTLGWLCPIL